MHKSYLGGGDMSEKMSKRLLSIVVRLGRETWEVVSARRHGQEKLRPQRAKPAAEARQTGHRRVAVQVLEGMRNVEAGGDQAYEQAACVRLAARDRRGYRAAMGIAWWDFCPCFSTAMLPLRRPRPLGPMQPTRQRSQRSAGSGHEVEPSAARASPM